MRETAKRMIPVVVFAGGSLLIFITGLSIGYDHGVFVGKVTACIEKPTVCCNENPPRR